MSAFNDITIYSFTRHRVGDPEYYEETALKNYISDLYIRHMYGYKPPNTTRVSIQADLAKMWNRPWRDGSLRLISAVFNYDFYSSLDKFGRYKYILDIIQQCMLELSDEYGWDKAVFEKAYDSVLESDYKFEIVFPSKISRNKKISATLSLRKSEKLAQILVDFHATESKCQVVLVEKKNWFWYDSTYKMIKKYGWFDNDRFGVSFKEADLKIWYDVVLGNVFYQHGGLISKEFDLETVLKF